MSRPVAWFEILGKDGKALREFYGDVFGWQYDVVEEMDYGMLKVEEGQEGIQGGVGTGQNGMSYATIYISVEDVGEYLKKIEAKGCKILVPRTVIPDMVTFGVFEDPEGHPVGIYQ